MKSNKKGYLVPECEEMMLTIERCILSGNLNMSASRGASTYGEMDESAWTD